jgi:hypothetical protein
VEKITLTAHEQERYDIIRSCIDGDMTNAEASKRLGLKVRQIQNIKRSVKTEGMQGSVHKSKGKTSGNATSKAIVDKVTTFFKDTKHQDFGPTFAQEKLCDSGVVIGTETLRSLMITKGIWKPHRRRGSAIHREWRERKECFGELVQFDGSYHDWFETKQEACLLAAIDDATGHIIKAMFEDNEGVFACFRFWLAYVEHYGRPVAIYLDKFSTYKVNHKNAVDNADMMTQFERAMKALDIRVICANSPEAKGRVERLFGTLQDRMVKEMRLVDVNKQDEANIFLKDTYIPDHNRRFSVEAKSTHDAHRPLTDMMKSKLLPIFSIHSIRKVNNDYTIQFKTQWFQLDAVQNTTVYRRDTVTVEEWLDESIHIRLKQTYLMYTILPVRPKPMNIPVVALTGEKPSWKPPKSHPWRKPFF